MAQPGSWTTTPSADVSTIRGSPPLFNWNLPLPVRCYNSRKKSIQEQPRRYVGTAALGRPSSGPRQLLSIRVSIRANKLSHNRRSFKLTAAKLTAAAAKSRLASTQVPPFTIAKVREPNSFSILHIDRNSECAAVPAHSWAPQIALDV